MERDNQPNPEPPASFAVGPLPGELGAEAAENPADSHARVSTDVASPSLASPALDSPPAASAARSTLTAGMTTARQWISVRVVSLRRWARANTFTPRWLPDRLRHPLTGYGLTIALDIAAILLDLFLKATLPRFDTLGVLPLLVVAGVALTFGMGPSVAATLLSALLFEFVILPPRFSFSAQPSDLIQVLLLLLVGAGISLVAGRTERSRQLAEGLALSERAKQARLEAILTTAPDLISIYDARGHLIESNRSGAGANDVTGKDVLASILGRLTEETQAEPIVQALRGEVVSGVETNLRDETTGETRVVMLSAAPFKTTSGAVEGVVAVGRDITLARHADQATAALAGELDAILRTVPDAVMVFGRDGRILRMNPAARTILGLEGGEDFYSQPQATRGRTSDVYDESERSLPMDEWPYARILRGEVLAGADAVDVIMSKPGQPRRELAVNGAPLRDEDGAITRAVCVIRDVTERRRLERRTREALDALLEMAHTLIELPSDAATREGGADQARGASTESAVARRLAELTCGLLGCKRVGITAVEPETDRLRFIAVIGLSPEQEAQWWAEQRRLEEQGVRLGDGADPDEMARFRAGEVFVLDMTEPRFRDLPNPYGVTTTLVAPMRVRDTVIGMLSLDYGGVRHIFTEDEIALANAIAQFCAVVIERERLLREREAAQAYVLALTEINRRMDAFLGMTGHELKTPLTTSSVNTQLGQRRLKRLRAEVEQLGPEKATRLIPLVDTLDQLFGRIASATDRELRLVDDLLDVTRIQADKLELVPARFDLVTLARESVAEQQAHHRNRTILIEAPDEPLLVQADRDRIRQVVANYLTNALKYSPATEPVKAHVTCEEGSARLSVRDAGPGIPTEEQERVWERFHRVPSIAVQSGSGIGLGLGLYICRQIIERQNGSVGLRSAPGEGSTFWFTLPLARD